LTTNQDTVLYTTFDINSHSINWKCGPTTVKRDSLYLDDVLLATAIGCGTDNGASSITKSFVNHGVDCVIGTKKTVLVEVMNFWNYYFWDELITNDRNIAEASMQSYSKSQEMLATFLGVTELSDYYDSSIVIGRYDTDMTIVSKPSSTVLYEKITSARYGRKER